MPIEEKTILEFLNGIDDYEVLDEDVDELLEELEKGGLLDEALSLQQRVKRSRTMKKHRAKIRAGRRRSEKRAATRERVQKRAKRRAISATRKSVSKKSYSSMSAGQKSAIDRRVKGRSAFVNQLAKRKRMDVKKDERRRRSGGRRSYNEEFEHTLNEDCGCKDCKAKKDKMPFKHKKAEKQAILDEAYIKFAQDILEDFKIQKKFNDISEKHKADLEIVEQLFFRGAAENFSISEGFARVHSSLNGGRSAKEDADLLERVDPMSFIWKQALKELESAIKMDKGKKHSLAYHAQRVAQGFKEIGRKELLDKFKSSGMMYEEGGAGEEATTKLKKKYKKDTPGEDDKIDNEIILDEAFESFLAEKAACQVFTPKDMKNLEMFADRLLNKFGVDIEFTKHFGERMGDARNKPCIDMEEMIEFFRKMTKSRGMKLKRYAGDEAVLKDIQADLNMPVVLEFNRKGDLEVRFKTIMRKKNFKSPDPVVKYK